MAKRNKKRKSKIIILVIIVLLLMLLLIAVAKRKRTVSQTDIEKANIEYLEESKKKIIEDLSGKSEQQRMQYYCANFFKLIDGGQYEDAYELLYSDYKENYFPTLQNFKRYFEEYFPSDFSLSYTNMERLGDIYVLMINVSDTLNGSYGHNFSLYAVIKENALNDYVISFSRNSAVGEEE